MQLQLDELTKKELINILQNYQELINEIERHINMSPYKINSTDMRSLLNKYVYKV